MISPMLCLFIVASVRITVLYYHCSEPSSRTKFYVDQLNVTLACTTVKQKTRIPRNALFEIAFNRHLKKNCWHILELDDDVCARRAAPRRVLSERTFSLFIVVLKHYLSEFCCASVVGYRAFRSLFLAYMEQSVCSYVPSYLLHTTPFPQLYCMTPKLVT